MRRRLYLLFAFVGVLSLIGLTPASADHGGKDLPPPHENSPSPPALPLMEIDGECAVVGEVGIDDEDGMGGVTADQKNHNHFFFDETEINCVAVPAEAGGDGENYAGAYAVDAAGGTDGQGECDEIPGKDPQCETNHGEQLSQGWSHSSCYADPCALPGASNPAKMIDDLYDGTNTNPATPGQCYNCNEIRVERVDPVTGVPDGKASGFGDTSNNWLKFCRGIYDDHGDPDTETCSNIDTENFTVGDKPFASRGGGNVIAWGVLTDWTLNGQPNPDKAGEVLCFVADLEFTPSGTNPNDPTKITNAVLVGEADVWVFGDKGECVGKKKKT